MQFEMKFISLQMEWDLLDGDEYPCVAALWTDVTYRTGRPKNKYVQYTNELDVCTQQHVSAHYSTASLSIS